MSRVSSSPERKPCAGRRKGLEVSKRDKVRYIKIHAAVYVSELSRPELYRDLERFKIAGNQDSLPPNLLSIMLIERALDRAEQGGAGGVSGAHANPRGSALDRARPAARGSQSRSAPTWCAGGSRSRGGARCRTRTGRRHHHTQPRRWKWAQPIHALTWAGAERWLAMSVVVRTRDMVASLIPFHSSL